MSEFPVPTADSSPHAITAGPDGSLWFTESLGNKIGRITTAGAVSEFAIPTPASGPSAITAGPDGNLWFTEFTGNKIGRLCPGATLTATQGANVTPAANPKTEGPPLDLHSALDGGPQLLRPTKRGLRGSAISCCETWMTMLRR